MESRMSKRRNVFSDTKMTTDINIKIKTLLNDKEMDKFVFKNKVSIRKVLPTLDNDKVYKMDIFYKDIDEYIKDSIELFLSYDLDELSIFSQKKKKWFSRSHKYLSSLSDLQVSGYSKKILSIKETDEKIYVIHILSVHSQSTDKKKMYDFDKKIVIITRDTIRIDDELNKILGKYIYKIYNIRTENCDIDTNDYIFPTSHFNKIFIEVMIDRKKETYQRFIEYFKL